jgi:hypothetical protein
VTFKKGLSNSLNSRQKPLSSDFDSANVIPEYYDTDIENFWSNPNNFLDQNGKELNVTEKAQLTFELKQKFLVKIFC